MGGLWAQDGSEINDDIRTYERLVQTEEQRIESMGYEPSKENMSEHSFKYDGLIAKIIELEDDAIELKTRLADYKLPQSSKIKSRQRFSLAMWNCFL